ncbi:hypothetical protein BG000_008178 [Podila horticola]|nr:hypothetical protein BG000_008178 [Podila horticola]
MHNTTLVLATSVAAALVAYALKPKKAKTELEAQSKAVPVMPYYLPFQIDAVLGYISGVLSGDDEMEGLRELSMKLGSTMNLRGMNEDYIVVLEPACIQHILAKNQPNYEKGSAFKDIFHEFLGSGIFNADGDIWKTQRQLARPHFQTSEFKDSALINKHVDQLLKVLNKTLSTKPDEAVEVQNLFCRFTMDAASEFLFGENVNSLEHEQSEFSTAFNYAQSISAWRFRVPYWKIFVPKRRLLREIAVLDKFVYNIIDNAIARQEQRIKDGAVAENKNGHDTLLDHFLSYQKENNFSSAYLRDMLLNFLIAGRDTTASLMTWTMWELSQNPEIKEKLVAEIMEQLGPDTVPSYVEIKKLKYQKQVVNEVLRLHPPVPFNMRQSVEEDVLPNGYYVPPKVPVSYSAYITHRMPELWGEDALIFDPDRWGPERVGKIRPFMFVPFHAGPRICLGQNFAYTEAQITLTRLLQNYDIVAKDGFKPKPIGDIVLFSGNGVEVYFKKRSHSEI